MNHDTDRRGANDGVSGEPPPPSGGTFILVVGSGPALRDVESTLARRGHPLLRASNAASALPLSEQPNVALTVVALPLQEGRASDFFDQAKVLTKRMPVLVVGADADVDDAARAFELGASEYVKDAASSPADFLSTVGMLLGARKIDRHLQYLRQKEAPRTGWQSIVGESPALQRVLAVLQQVSLRAKRGATPMIFIDGETGTGKGFIAKCVHYTGVRRNRPFVDVNCAALPGSLMEAELFGYERGSFTDAKTARAGLFETADGGTLFLDEIGAVPLDLQAKLLTAIDEKRVRRIGARQGISVDIQIVCATHEDLRRKVREGHFREDLFHRLNVVAVTVPALRERGNDVALLAEAFLSSLCREYGIAQRRITKEAIDWMSKYPWPGNVRELKNQIERIVLLENDDLVRPEHFHVASEGAVTGGGEVVIRKSGSRLRLTLPEGGVEWAELEREVLREALERCSGNVSRAARFLSMSRQTLIYRMKKYSLAGSDQNQD
jgi:DNA-binding NtrC family response regulator